ncbi:hypothetical protein [Rugamonas aquatica]|uniref:Uncharacterized protein n=1 Tax=Rugamonas aquatica TaxID=2743357 RepID=A0A6A7N2A8_9BURK|nr:hypothetical protein [Rugamonas aquatica]MQA39135.1 hypothetical protein [Rugamonas aquatica]
MRVAKIGLLMGVLFATALASAAVPEGRWKFERAGDFEGRIPANQAPPFPTLEFSKNEVSLSASCVAKVTSEPYYFPDVFQPLTKQGISAKQMDYFLLKNFHLALAGTKEIYSLDSTEKCGSRRTMEFFVIGDRILAVTGITFYSYVKVPVEASAGPQGTIASAYKLSQLPLDYDRYYASCLPKILAKGRPHTTDKCAPDYFPYVADPKSSDPIMKLVGNHDYSKWGQQYTEGFSPPFQQKIPATFLVFAPMKDVVLVRVDDFAYVRNEERDIMSGVYLSIAGGKVVDQIYGCQFNRDYVCMHEGRARAKLLDNGKFQKLQ